MAHEVVLHVYDLSMGMARALSQPILGFALDYLPHTGIVCFGSEYWYGGGVQKERPHVFASSSGLAPCERIVLGRTSKTEAELDAFVRSISSRFTMAAYDLFRNNCNHYSSELCRFLLDGRDIPERIVRLPELVMSTPAGAAIGAMWQQATGGMQARMGTSDPLAAAFGAGARAGVTAAAGGGPSPVAAAPAAAPAAPAAAVTASHRVPEAGSFLLYEDATIAPVVSRLKAAGGKLPADSPHRLTPDDLALLALLAAPAGGLAAAAPLTLGADGAGSFPWSAAACKLAARVLREWPRSDGAMPALMLLRLLALRPDCVGALVAGGAGDGPLFDVLETMAGDPAGFGAPGPNNQALQTLVNIFRCSEGAAWAAKHAGKLVDVACREMRSERPDLRVIGAALAQNLANALPAREEGGGAAAAGGGAGGAAPAAAADDNGAEGVPEAAVQLLCACLTEVNAEKDKETVSRRLLAAGRLLLRCGSAASAFAASLDCDLPVRMVMEDATRTADVRALAAEVLTQLTGSAS